MYNSPVDLPPRVARAVVDRQATHEGTDERRDGEAAVVIAISAVARGGMECWVRAGALQS